MLVGPEWRGSRPHRPGGGDVPPQWEMGAEP